MNSRERLINSLFVSKVRIKSLEFFLLNPSKSIHLRAMVRELDEEINAVRRELMRLEKADIILSVSKGNRKYFELNRDNVFIPELIGLFNKTYGIGGEIIKNKEKLGNIDFAFLTSSFTRNIHIGNLVVDLVVIGDVNLSQLEDIIKKEEIKLGREIHYTVLSTLEFSTRKKRREDFVYNLIIQDNVFLIGKHEDFIMR